MANRLRRWATAVLISALFVAPAGAVLPPNVPEQHTRLPAFSLPFTPTPGSRVRDVELHVSTDQGKTWTYVGQQVPSTRREENKFRYVAPNDGSYWFGIRSIDSNNEASPKTLDLLNPGLVIHLDRRAPLIQLKAARQTKPNVVGVEWDVREEHFDPSRFTMEYRVPGQSEWVAQSLDAKPTGTTFWELTAAPKLEVRLRVSDRAGNEADAAIALLPDGTSSGASASTGTPAPNPDFSNNAVANPGRPAVHYINSTALAIPFRISNVGVSGVREMDLWYTRDQGKNWQKVPRTGDETNIIPQTPGDGQPIDRQFAFTAPGEGLYGFIVVVRSGVGIGDADPRAGEAPKRLVEVDTTKPEVEIKVSRGAGAEVRNVTVEWTARDKNLADRPVTLLYSTAKEGPWETIIGDLDAKGRYVWTVSDQGPFQFFVAAKATDKAGNVGTATGPDRITVDVSRPRAELGDPTALKK